MVCVNKFVVYCSNLRVLTGSKNLSWKNFPNKFVINGEITPISKIDVREGPVLGFTVQGLQISLSWGSDPIKSTLPIRGDEAVTYPDKRALGLVIHQFKTLAAKCLWLFWTSIFWNDCYFFLLFEWDSCTLFYFKFLGFSDRFYFHFPQSCTCSFCCFLSW